jgi:hypothetical protein
VATFVNYIYRPTYIYIFLWRFGPYSSPLRGFTISLRHITLGRTPLDERSARCRYLCLTTHNTRKRQTSMLQAGFESRNPRKRTAANPHLRRRGHWHRRKLYTIRYKNYTILLLSSVRMNSRDPSTWTYSVTFMETGDRKQREAMYIKRKY